MKKLSKMLLSLVMVTILVVPMFAGASNIDLWANSDTQLEGVGFDNDLDPQTTIIGVISLLLTFLGIVAVILFLWAGFLWMTAGGNEDKVATAKKIMISAVIGLVIILAAYGIVNWVLGEIVTLV